VSSEAFGLDEMIDDVLEGLDYVGYVPIYYILMILKLFTGRSPAYLNERNKQRIDLAAHFLRNKLPSVQHMEAKE
jgi:hypothetical protein